MNPQKKPPLPLQPLDKPQSCSCSAASAAFSKSSLAMNLPNDLNQEIAALERYRRGLRREDQLIFDQLMDQIKIHRRSCQQVDHLLSIEILLFTLLLEQQKQINSLITRLQSTRALDGL